jgi:ferredoxin
MKGSDAILRIMTRTREGKMARTVMVDRESCISCGLCVSMAPGVFRFEGGVSFAYDSEGASEEVIQQCIDGCPVTAIYWAD